MQATSSAPPIAMILVAAGRGTRLGGDLPKQYRLLDTRPVLTHALDAACRGNHLDQIITVIHPDDTALCEAVFAASQAGKVAIRHCAGGENRQDSVLNGLNALAAAGFPDHGIVLIHDAARPFLSEAVLMRAILAAQKHGAAIPVLPVADTLAEVADDYLVSNPPRAAMRLVQTPQAFRFGLIRTAHLTAKAENRSDFTDDAGLARAYCASIAVFEGDVNLFKITQESDLARAKTHLKGTEPAQTRVGIGYDVHAFTTGDHVILGGIAIPHDQSLLGHSDADPVLHALTDALLGTIGDGDIGMHFPPSDEKWRGAASRQFLEDAARRVIERGGTIVQVDTTIVCEAPKIGPHRLAIQREIGDCLGLAPDRVGVKATTSERLGFTGRKEGIAAIAVVSVIFEGKRV